MDCSGFSWLKEPLETPSPTRVLIIIIILTARVIITTIIIITAIIITVDITTVTTTIIQGETATDLADPEDFKMLAVLRNTQVLSNPCTPGFRYMGPDSVCVSVKDPFEN